MSKLSTLLVMSLYIIAVTYAVNLKLFTPLLLELISGKVSNDLTSYMGLLNMKCML